MTTSLVPVPQPDDAATGRRRRVLLLLVLALGAAVVLLAVTLWPVGGGDTAGQAAAPPPSLEVRGLTDGVVLAAVDVAAADVRITTDERSAASLVVHLDGVPVPTVDGAVRLDAAVLGGLDDGAHTLEAVAGDGDGAVRTSIGFTLDTTPPALVLPDLVEVDGYDDALVVTFEVADAHAVDVEVAGGDVALVDGLATATFAVPPRSVAVTATDAAGNVASGDVPVVVHFPGGRAVHVTPSAWRYAPKREPVLAMLEAGLIDAVQFDIKDELGDVSWDTDVELADLAGAEDFNRNFDMAAAIETIHAYDARVIGRLTVYRDHRLAQWAWENGRPDMVVQGTDGLPYAGRYGEYAFTNFAHPEVQRYNLDIALEAAALGFDDILYDYIRRPDGAIEKLVIPGIGDRTPEEAVVEVMATAYPLLREQGVWVGASVFGIAVDRPTQMAQDIPMMAEHVDYISPMVYPNHWNLGEYDVPVPEDAPYDIVERSLTLYREALEPTGTALMPWLQDFGGYGEPEVRAQIDATEDVTGERSFLLWSSGVEYTVAALDPIPGRAGTTAAP